MNMANDPTIIDLLYDLLDQQPTNVYIWERIIEAWEAEDEKGRSYATLTADLGERLQDERI